MKTMIRAEKVADIMTSNVLKIDVTQSLKDANDLFAKHHIRHIPVVAGARLIGIISRTDILRISFGNSFSEDQAGADAAIFDMLSINQVMKHSPETVDSRSKIRDVAKLLSEREFHALPVVDNGKLVGIVTTTDIIKYFLDN